MATMRAPGEGFLPGEDEFEQDRFKRYGLWKAEVLRVDDDQFRGRIQVRVLQLHPPAVQPTADTKPGEAKEDFLSVVSGSTPQDGVPPDACPWAEPCYPFGGKKTFNSGAIMTPYVGSTVWVAFEQGFSGKPVWLGSWLGSNEIPSEIASPEKMQDVRLIRTEFGHLLLFDDTLGEERAFLGVAPDTGDRVRFLEFDEANQQVRLFNDPDGAGTGTGTRLYMTEDEVLISKGNPGSNVSMTLNDGLITLKAGSTTLTINKDGDVSLETGTNCTLTVTGNVDIAATGTVDLGVGAISGVALAPLLTTLANFMTLYAAHTHTISSGSSAGTTTPPITGSPVAPVAGVDSSLTVKAKV